MPIGKISTEKNNLGVDLEWCIEDFWSFPVKDGYCYDSPPFSFDNQDWQFFIYPNGSSTRGSYGHVDLSFYRVTSGPPTKLEFSLSLKAVSEDKYNEVMATKVFHDWDFYHPIPRIIHRSNLENKRSGRSPSSALTMVCKLKGISKVVFPTFGSDSSIERAARCCHCKKTFYADIISSHQRQCPHRPIKCQGCFEDVLLQNMLDGHKCQNERTGGNVKNYSYSDMRKATKKFSHKLRTGAFGTVYKGGINGKVVAAMVLEGIDKQFTKDLEALSSFKHAFLVPVIGYCDDPAHLCLVFEYIVNGSLEDRLACKGNVQPLPWDVRLIIAYCCILGIKYLHAQGQIHTDISSANILLDEDLFPKVADFGMVKIGDGGTSSVDPITRNWDRPSPYMAPEAYDADVSVKLDIYSFGVVLLELLTGLPPNYRKKSLSLYIDRIQNMLDSRANWDVSVAKGLHEISKRCLKELKKDRPIIDQVLADLTEIIPENPSIMRMLTIAIRRYSSD